MRAIRYTSGQLIEQLLALKQNGGVVQLVALSSFVKTPTPDSPERAAAAWTATTMPASRST